MSTDTQTPAAIGALLDVAPVDVSPEEVAAREAAREKASADLVREMRKADAVRRWEIACPEQLKRTDWQHPSLARNGPQIARVLGYKVNPRGIIATGPTGRGKSRAMWALMRRLGCDEGHDVRYWSASDWFSTLQEHTSYGRDYARGWVETVASRRIVFIDDVGQEAIQTSKQEWATGWFFRFLDLRVGAGLPLFATTNLTASEMSERSGNVRGDPLVRRLLDLCEPVKFD